MLTVAEPELIKLILVKDFHVFRNRKQRNAFHEIVDKNLFFAIDDHWKRLRAIVSPTFTSGKVKKMSSLIDECTKNCLENLEFHVNNKKNMNLKEVFGSFTMDCIAKCAFGTDINANKNADNPFVVNAKQLFTIKILKILLTNLLPIFLLRLFRIKSVFNEENNQFFIRVARHIIRKRRESNQMYNDFLQLLMDCQSNENNKKEVQLDSESHYLNEEQEESELETLKFHGGKKELTEDEIVAQAWVFFLAGYETTATTLSFCTYELALNQDIQEKLYQEIESVSKNNQQIDYETLTKLPYLDAIVSETLRKYSPFIRLERSVSENYNLLNTGIKLSKGDLIEIPVYAIHHCEEFYPSPEQFKPERFLAENRHLIKPYTYLPFGAGPRNCIGMRFGLLETKLCLFKIIQKYRFYQCANTDVPLKFFPLRKIIAAKKMVVGIEAR